jgi:hypothetical protein
MSKKFANPYILFYPTVSRDRMPPPLNKVVQAIQGQTSEKGRVWRGNIVIAKYSEDPLTSMIDTSMSDFPILKNFFLTQGCPNVRYPRLKPHCSE